jgi:uncharacterized membrane protein
LRQNFRNKGAKMSQLIVVGFKQDMYRASVVLNKLTAMDFSWVVDLHDAVAVYRDYKGKLRVDQSYQMTTREGAGWGAFWGSLIGATLALPFTAGASSTVIAGTLAAGALGGGTIGAAGGAMDADQFKQMFGIPGDFVTATGAMVQPGDSAILALLRTSDPAYVAEQFRGYGGTVLQTTLSKEQSDKGQAVLTNR